MSDLITLIKQSGAVREFKDKDVPDSFVDKILEAGIWGLSVLGIQPWKFVAVQNKYTLVRLSDILLEKSDAMAQGANIVLRVTAKIIKSSKIIIVVYNNKMLEKRTEKLGPIYVERAHLAEIQTIGGCIQNMILQTNELGLGCVWLDAITFCSNEINELLQEDGELIAFVAIGYPAAKPHRSQRQNSIIRKA